MKDYIYAWYVDGCEAFEGTGESGEHIEFTHTGRMLGDCPPDGVFVGLVALEDARLGETLRLDDAEAQEEVDHLVDGLFDDDEI